MFAKKLSLVVLAFSGLVAVGSSQVVVHPRHHQETANPQGLAAVQQDLLQAVQAMKSALPIYDGLRVSSIHDSHRALLIVDRGLMGSNAPTRVKPAVNDSVASGQAKSRYSAAQLTSSQSDMQVGLTALEAAQSDLQRSVHGNYGPQGRKLVSLLQQAVSRAKAALALHQH